MPPMAGIEIKAPAFFPSSRVIVRAKGPLKAVMIGFIFQENSLLAVTETFNVTAL